MGLFGIGKNKQVIEKTEKQIPESKVSRTMIMNTILGTVHWSPKDYFNFSNEAYMKNVISYRCIFYIATNLAQVKWGMFKKVENKREEITDNPISKLLKRANPLESFVVLIQKAISYLLISGNSYIEKVAPTGGINKGIPRELYILRPDRVRINTNAQTGQISDYEYSMSSGGAAGIKFPIDPITLKADICHLKLFHPLNDYFGMSVTEPTAREIDSSNEAIEWQKKMFENEGRPGMAVFIHGFLSDPQWDRLEKQLKENHGGSDNAGKTIIIEGESAGDVKPYSWSPKEMDWIESNRELSRKICLGYGVPPMLLGIPGDNTYSNMQEARAGFWEETIIFYLELLTGELNNWLFETDEIFISYDINDIPAMAYKQAIIWNRIKDANFMTIDEKREAVGMEKLPSGNGGVILVAMGMTPLDTLVQTPDATGQNNNSGDQNKPDQNLTDQEQQQQNQEEVQKLVREGMDEKIAKLLMGEIYA